MNIRPLYDRVIVQRLEELKVSRGGIIIPDNATEKPAVGFVIACGEGRLIKDTSEVLPLKVKEQDKVLFAKYAGTEYTIEGQAYLIIREDDIIGVIDD